MICLYLVAGPLTSGPWAVRVQGEGSEVHSRQQATRGRHGALGPAPGVVEGVAEGALPQHGLHQDLPRNRAGQTPMKPPVSQEPQGSHLYRQSLLQ